MAINWSIILTPTEPALCNILYNKKAPQSGNVINLGERTA